MLKSVLIALCLFAATVHSQELKVDVISVPEVCEQKSKAGDTVRFLSYILSSKSKIY